jgi:hypothetical protein
VNASLQIEQRAAAVSLFDGDGKLNHLPPVDLASSRHDAGHDAVLQPARVPDRHDRLPLFQLVGIPQRQRGEAVGGDADQRQIERPVERMHGRDVVRFPVISLHRNRPRLADDVQVCGDQPLRIDDEAAAQPLLAPVAPLDRDDHDRFAGRFGELFDTAAGRRRGCFFAETNAQRAA